MSNVPAKGEPVVEERTRRVRLDWAFAGVALVVGHVLIVMTPPFQSADEPQHFFRAYQITRGEFISREKNALGESGGVLPTSLDRFWTGFIYLVIHPERRTSAHYILQYFKMPLNPAQTSLVAFSNTGHYFPASYLPQAIGIALGRLLGLPPPMLLYLAREANLLVFVGLGVASLRAAPAIAGPLFLLLLIPTLLSLAASASGDVFCDGLVFLFTALVGRYFADSSRRIGRRGLLALGLVTVPFCVGKYVYLPLLGMLALVPASRFGGRGGKVLSILLLGAINVGLLAAWSAATSNLDTRITTEAGIAPRRQLARLERAPGDFGPILWNTAKESGWFVCRTFVAVIGWLDGFMVGWAVILYLLLLAGACCVGCGERPLPGPAPTAAIVLPAVVISTLGLALLNFLFWTPVGFDHIRGMQGRYFFPLAPAMFVLGCSIFQTLRGERARRHMGGKILILISVAYNVYLVYCVYARFYGGASAAWVAVQ